MTENEKILQISEAVKEKLELKLYDQDSGEKYRVLSIDGKIIPEQQILLISFDCKQPVFQTKEEMKKINQEDQDQYYGEINVLLCKKRPFYVKNKSLIVVKKIRKLYTVRQWISQSKKIKIADILL